MRVHRVERMDLPFILYLIPEGSSETGRMDGKNINNYIAVVLNNEVVSAAFIKSQIFDQGQIDGRFTREEAKEIAENLKADTCRPP